MLLDFQRQFSSFVLQGMPAPPGIDRAPGVGMRFDVYRRNVAGNLTGALSGAYPAVYRALGEVMFSRLVSSFASASPPAEADLHRYGEGFARYLAGEVPQPAWLLDLARLDWARSCALHAPTAEPLAPEIMAAARAERLVLRPHPSLRLLALDHHVSVLHEALVSGDDEAALTASRDIVVARETLAVLRGTRGMTVLALSPAAFRLATLLAGGMALGAALADEADSEPLGLFLLHGFFTEADTP